MRLPNLRRIARIAMAFHWKAQLVFLIPMHCIVIYLTPGFFGVFFLFFFYFFFFSDLQVSRY